jgi:hypothetical protein
MFFSKNMQKRGIFQQKLSGYQIIQNPKSESLGLI